MNYQIESRWKCFKTKCGHHFILFLHSVLRTYILSNVYFIFFFFPIYSFFSSVFIPSFLHSFFQTFPSLLPSPLFPLLLLWLYSTLLPLRLSFLLCLYSVIHPPPLLPSFLSSSSISFALSSTNNSVFFLLRGSSSNSRATIPRFTQLVWDPGCEQNN